MSFPIHSAVQIGAFGRYDMQVFMVRKRQRSYFNDCKKPLKTRGIDPHLVVFDRGLVRPQPAARWSYDLVAVLLLDCGARTLS
jgi:hypothetical protein